MFAPSEANGGGANVTASRSGSFALSIGDGRSALLGVYTRPINETERLDINFVRQGSGRGIPDLQFAGRFGASLDRLLRRSSATANAFDGLRLTLRRWTAFGISMPLWLAPRSSSHVTAENGLYRFFVEISHPMTGLIVRYQGWLA